MLKSSPDRYGAVPVTIHWLTAILIIFALGSGFRAGNALDLSVKADFLRMHIPAAIMVLLLTVLRIVWWWFLDKKPRPVQGAPLWQERLARGVHIAFYVVILGMAASGIGMIVLSGAGPAIFGGAGSGLSDFMQYPPRIPHGLGANFLLALLLAHVGAALYHHFIRRDGLLRRMWYGR
ncbi:cytochrome b [Roseomonas gilardii]|uniref:cytochrome b n=1 Tax=Roseomonas gilardii TaxID=257708 RepID=UPI0004AFB135|nr:cytochrome b/b6 domain-containing protein [Roseomonas gilardii]SUE43049.1 Cytochrome b561 homolog 1 [Roseomonas gilardii subsp. rosea]